MIEERTSDVTSAALRINALHLQRQTPETETKQDEISEVECLQTTMFNTINGLGILFRRNAITKQSYVRALRRVNELHHELIEELLTGKPDILPS